MDFRNGKGFFITGTDTGVGKTVITGALIKAMGLLGLKACGMKPVETGCLREGDILIPSDGMFIKSIANMDEPAHIVSPCCFETPLAPLTSSEIEGISIDLNMIKKTYTELTKKYDAIVVEGIGGLLVPIKRDYYVIDLIKEFGLPVIIVSRPGLGTLNHTMLTVNYLIHEGHIVAGIIINYTSPPENTLAEKTNPGILKQISPVPIIGIFQYLQDLGSNNIEKSVVRNLNLEILKKYL